ncbi:MAG TPA: Vms1/Ankzf1 family peptidyl-tRNA hydrolase [Dehalococcoidia bacterium]|nr:Vms1/Ankzf1 family peptidyl-tRNA hydrolase [Dehalococcoidia bacterium]
MLNDHWRRTLRELADIEDDDLPFLTVTMDLRPDGAARRESLTWLSQAMLDRDADRKSLPYHGDALKTFEDDLAWVRDYVGDFRGGRYDPASKGIVFFACGARGIRRVIELPVPIENRLAVAGRPVLIPLAAAVASYPDYLVAPVDADSCRLFAVSMKRVWDRAEHQGDTADLSWTAREGGWSLKRYQRHIDHWRSAFAEESMAMIVQELSRVDAPYLVLIGEEWAVAELRRHLPEALSAEVVFGGHVMVDLANEAQVVGEAEPVVQKEYERRVREQGDRIVAAASEGRPAAMGLGPVVRALEEGAVSLLVLPPSLEIHGWRCTSCGHLSEGESPGSCPLCRQQTTPVDMGEVILREALRQDAQIFFLSSHAELGSYGGVGALLRFPVSVR